MTQEAYNAHSVELYVLDGLPGWLDLTVEELVDPMARAKREEKQGSLGVKQDGLYGPRTLRAIGIEDHRRVMESGARGAIILGPRAYPVDREVKQYVDTYIRDDLRGFRRDEPARQLAFHHSVTVDNEETYEVLDGRGPDRDGDGYPDGYSTHFAVQWDGELSQYLDPITMYALHVGGIDVWRTVRGERRRVSGNPHTIGFDFSSLAVPESQARHVRRWGEERPYFPEARGQGRIERYRGRNGMPGGLGYSDAEKACALEVARIVCGVTGIPWRWPSIEMGVIDDPLHYEGMVKHGHLTARKSDPIAFDMDEVFGGGGDCV